MIVADTSAVVALIDADDKHHGALVALYERAPADWILPWPILPEVDYLLLKHVGVTAQQAFLGDLASGNFAVEWGNEADLVRANQLCKKYHDLALGLVDATVAAIAERLRASAIATLDLRHFGVMLLAGSPALIPRDG